MAANAYFDEEGYEYLFVGISRCHRPRIGKDIKPIFVVFRVHWIPWKKAFKPNVLISNNLQHLIIRINFLDLKHEKHGSDHSLFCCSAPCSAVATFKGVYGGFLRKKEQIPMALGTRYAMCIWKNSCSKGSTLYTHLKNSIFGPENKVIVEKQEDNF